MAECLLYVPSPPFLMYVLAAARALNTQFSCRNIIICPDDLSGAISAEMATLCNIVEVVADDTLPDDFRVETGRSTNTEGRSLQRLRDTYDIRFVAGHNENSKIPVARLAEEFPHADLLLYADGLRNAFDGDYYRRSSAKRMIFFGIVHHRWDFPIEQTLIAPIGDFHKVIEIAARDAGLGPRARLKPKVPYSIFYTRYWGIGGYNFPIDLVAESWIETIERHCQPGELIVLKKAPVQPDIDAMIARFEADLLRRGFKVQHLAEFLEENWGIGDFANQSTEILMSGNALIDANNHFTLDSSLSYTIASSKRLERPTNIIIAAYRWNDMKTFHPGMNVVSYNGGQQYYSLNQSPECKPIEFTLTGADFPVHAHLP